MKNKLVLLVLALLITGSQSHTATNVPVLLNGGFEGGMHLATTYWTPLGGPFHHQFIEITPPENWTAWWHEGFPCIGDPGRLQGRPEERAITTVPDSTRVHSGNQAFKFFTLWRCHRGGVYQRITVEPGKHYTVQAFVHTWFSNCSSRPHHDVPLDYDCRTSILWAHDWLRIGIDPLGGIDPTAPSVKWSTGAESYGRYGDPLMLRHVQAVSGTMTIFLESTASHPLKHCDVYWDDVTLSESYRVFLPHVVRSQ